jgi:hypothetical protein
MYLDYYTALHQPLLCFGASFWVIWKRSADFRVVDVVGDDAAWSADRGGVGGQIASVQESPSTKAVEGTHTVTNPVG